MIQFYYADVEKLNQDNLFQMYYEQLSEYRRKKVDAFRFRKDKNLCLGAGILLDSFLKQYDSSEREVGFAVSEYGKPYFETLSALQFSISHSGTIAAAAFSDQDIGCDVEKKGEMDLQVAKRFFCEDEIEMILRQNSEEERRRLFFRYWTLKESFVKITGQGLHLSLNSFCILLNEKNISVRQEIDRKKYFFAEFDSIPDYSCSLCALEDCGEIRLQKIEL